jgi:hypothetical protein
MSPSSAQPPFAPIPSLPTCLPRADPVAGPLFALTPSPSGKLPPPQHTSDHRRSRLPGRYRFTTTISLEDHGGHHPAWCPRVWDPLQVPHLFFYSWFVLVLCSWCVFSLSSSASSPLLTGGFSPISTCFDGYFSSIWANMHRLHQTQLG